MTSDSKISADDLLGRLAEDYVAKLRAGENPSLEEIAANYPELADDIRSVFPMLGVMEDVGDQSFSKTKPTVVKTLGALHQDTRLGEYRIVREIGRGGMGVVYEAEHTTLERRVALKVLPACNDDSLLKERFYREARAAARLHHTNIVPVFDFGEDNGVPYYAMQCIDGRGLDQLVDWVRSEGGDLSSGSISGFWENFHSAATATDRSGDLRDEKLRRWHFIATMGIQAADAVQYAHEQGIIHRDIKPSNLLLDQGYHLWITDFGLAKLNDDLNLTMTGDLVGTLRYLPPESTRSETSTLSDVYGLGLVLYELTTLTRPFEDVSRLRLIKRIVDSGPTPIRSLRADVPRDLRTIIQKAIDREPESRYQSAAALAEDLRRFVEDKPIKARPHSTLAHVWRWARRNRLAASLLSMVALMIVTGFVASTLFAIHLKGVVGERNSALKTASEERTEAAEKRDEALERLFESKISQAQAIRSSNQIGQRFRAIKAIEEAVELLPLVESDDEIEFRLRSELIGALSLTDSDIVEEWENIGKEFDRYSFDYNSSINCVFYTDPKKRQAVLKRIDTGEVVFETKLNRTGWMPTPRLSPNGRWASATLQEGAWKDPKSTVLTVIYDAKNGTEKLRFKRLLRAKTNCAFDGGNKVAIPRENSVVIFDLEKSQEVDSITLERMPGLVGLSRDSRRVAIAFNDSPQKTVRAWDLETDKIIFDSSFASDVRAPRWNCRGDELAIPSGLSVEVWHVSSTQAAKMKFRRSMDDFIFHIAFTEDGECLLASTWGHATSIWDTSHGRKLLHLSGTLGWGTVVGQKHRLAIHRGNQLSFCQFVSGVERRVALPAEVKSLWTTPIDSAVHPNGRLVALATSYGVRLADSVEARELGRLLLGYTEQVLFSHDGRSLFTNDNYSMTEWPLRFDTDTGLVNHIGPPQRVDLPLSANDKYRTDRIAMQSGATPGVFRVAAEKDRYVTFKTWIFDTRSSALPIGLKTRDRVNAIGPNGRLIAHGNSVSDSITGKLKWKIPPSTLSQVFFSTDGSLLFQVGDNIVSVFDAEDGKLLYDLGDIDVAWPTSFSPDGELAILSVRRPAGFMLIESRTGKKIAHFPISKDAVPRNFPARFAAGGTRIVSFGRGNELLSWDIAAIRENLQAFDLDWASDRPPPQDVWTAPRKEPVTIDFGGQRRSYLSQTLQGNPHPVDGRLIEFLGSLLSENPDDEDCLVVRAMAHYRLQNYKLALDDAENALRLVPDDEDALELKAKIEAALAGEPAK